MPLQSGDDGVLRAMGRRYTTATYLRRLEPLAAEFNLTTDVIVGFPAEDERAFARTLETVEAAGLTARPCLPVLAAPRHPDGRGRSRPERREEGAQRSPARALARARAAPLAARSSAPQDTVLVDRPGRGYGDDYSPFLVDAPVGALVRVRADSRRARRGSFAVAA